MLISEIIKRKSNYNVILRPIRRYIYIVKLWREIKRKSVVVVCLCVPILLSGCIHFPTSSSNFRNRVFIWEEHEEFFHSVENEKLEPLDAKEKFKPIDAGDYRIRTPDGHYKLDLHKAHYPPGAKEGFEPLDAKDYRINIHDDYNKLDLHKAYEWSVLVAAELAVQLGFKKFIIYNKSSDTSSNNCYPNELINNSGGIVSVEVNCLGSFETHVLIFNDYSDIKNGGVWFKNKDSVLLTMPTIDRNGNIRTVEPFAVIYGSPTAPWSSYYEAEETAQSLREKYRLGPKNDYQISRHPEPEIFPTLKELEKTK